MTAYALLTMCLQSGQRHDFTTELQESLMCFVFNSFNASRRNISGMYIH